MIAVAIAVLGLAPLYFREARPPAPATVLSILPPENATSVDRASVSPDGRTIVSGTSTGEVKFWDWRTGQEVLTLRRHAGPVTVVEFAANGKFLVTGGDRDLATWEARE